MKPALHLFALPALLAAARTLTSTMGPVVDLGYAAFAGNTTSPAGVLNGPVAFYGNIPFAQPPLGELRWRAPVMIDESGTTETVSDARNWGPACIQRPAVPGIGSEDCLTLNVWKPTNVSAGANLPVTVYIHGGGFYANTPQGFPLYDWVAQNPHLIGVSITYRLNMWGFLASAVVAGDGDLNVGLRDQRAGLEWVQRHISAFGGNPDEVTILGESAGGASMMMQTVAFGGKQPAPFKRVVAQSIGFGPTNTNDQNTAFFESAAQFIGCPTSGADSMPCMRKASVGALIGAVNHIQKRRLRSRHRRSFRSAKHHHRPIPRRPALVAHLRRILPRYRLRGRPLHGRRQDVCERDAGAVCYGRRCGEDCVFSREAIAYWTSFGTTGNATEQTRVFPRLGAVPCAGNNASTDGRAHLVLTRGADGGSVTASKMGSKTPAEIERCVFWMSENITT